MRYILLMFVLSTITNSFCQQDRRKKGEFEKKVETVIDTKTINSLGTLVNQFDEDEIDVAVLEKLYSSFKEQMWDENMSGSSSMSGFVSLGRKAKSDKLLSLLQKDIYMFKNFEDVTLKALAEGGRYAPSSTSLAYVFQWIADSKGIDNLEPIFVESLKKERVDVAKIIVGGYNPRPKDKIEAANYFMKFYAYTYTVDKENNNGNLIRSEMKLHAEWLDPSFYVFLEKLISSDR